MTVRDVFLTHGKAYLDAFGQRMPAHHKKVIQAIIQCRTPDLGTILCACEDCANTYLIFRFVRFIRPKDTLLAGGFT